MAVSLKLQVTKKKSKCPPKYNWLNMLWYVHKMEEKYGEELLYVLLWEDLQKYMRGGGVTKTEECTHVVVRHHLGKN